MILEIWCYNKKIVKRFIDLVILHMQDFSQKNLPDTNPKNVENSDILKHTLMSLIKVSSSKTSDDYAWSSIKKLLDELKTKYDFLKLIHIGKIRDLSYNSSDIVIDADFEKIDALKLGRAIQDAIDLLKRYLGTKAGYFFIQEFKSTLGAKYYSIIKEIGVDLRLVELQNDFSGLDTAGFKIKESSNSNIAFVEKIN